MPSRGEPRATATGCVDRFRTVHSGRADGRRELGTLADSRAIGRAGRAEVGRAPPAIAPVEDHVPYPGPRPMGAVAGARSHSGPAREAAAEIQSNVPWIGFPVGYAGSGVLLTVFGCFAMVLAQWIVR